jgi:hypothetical protein
MEKLNGTGLVPPSSVDDIKECLHMLLDAGAQVQQAVKDVGGGKLIASVNGNIIGLISHEEAVPG